jgi:riboflavin kinase/FMN adenylyltransferase
MKLIRNNYRCYTAEGCVATLGNFDGIHLGHQALLERLSEEKKVLNLPAVLITFEPLPKEFFSKKRPETRLMGFKEKWSILSHYSIDYVLCLQFNTDLSNLSPEDFIQKILLDRLKIKSIIVGDDFRFGAKRRGDYSLLQEWGKRYHFSAIQLPSVLYDHERISSTRIRHALQRGDLSLASTLLGRPYRLSGRVVHGEKRGRTLGFRTANIYLRKNAAVLSGVFIVEILLDGVTRRGVASVGYAPTFPGRPLLLEVHIFDFNETIYGRYMSVDFLHRLRAEEKYATTEALMTAIAQDVEDAKKYFAHRDMP